MSLTYPNTDREQAAGAAELPARPLRWRELRAESSARGQNPFCLQTASSPRTHCGPASLSQLLLTAWLQKGARGMKDKAVLGWAGCSAARLLPSLVPVKKGEQPSRRAASPSMPATERIKKQVTATAAQFRECSNLQHLQPGLPQQTTTSDFIFSQ